jgi:uncharacterized membrane protein
MVGLVLFITSIFQVQNLLANFFGLLSFTGLFVSVLLLGTELGFQSQIVKQVCGTFNESGCEQVLKSSYAKGIWDITPADVSLLYFATQFILYLLGCWGLPTIQSLLVLSMGGIGIAIWSLYTQAIKLKQWCGLCLAIVAILVLQATVASIMIQFPIPIIGFGLFVLLFIILALALLPIKQLVKTNSSNKIKLAELKKWKLDAGLFMNQWQQEQQTDTSIWQNDLIFGSPEAPLRITVACNLYCKPCANTHKQLDDLLKRFDDKLSLQVRLLFPSENGDDRFTCAAKAILQKATEGLSNNDLQRALASWFELMDLGKWTRKWHHDANIDVNQELMHHRHWIEQNKITYTPTLFLNGRKLPGRYTLADIEILIPQLSQLMPKKSKI